MRKLEYLLADAARQRADTLITCGGVQSNHCRATALAAAQFGLNCHLVLRGDHPDGLDGNLLLDALSGAELSFVTEQDYYSGLDEILAERSSIIRRRGGTPYIIPEGGSNAVGALGYISALSELIEQSASIGLHIDRIVCAAGSGGTHAGLLAGTALTGWDVEVVSASVCYDARETAQRIMRIIDDIQEQENSKLPISLDDVNVLDGYRGPGYARAGGEEYEVIIEAARAEGMIVDPVYTSKALRAVKMETLAGRMKGTTVFWHTGGVFGLFPFRGGLAEALRIAG